MSANETAREFLRRRFNGGKQLLDITLKEDQAAEFAEAYHSSQMSGIAQRAAEKIWHEMATIQGEALRLPREGKFRTEADQVKACEHIVSRVAAIISQEGR